MVDGDSAQWRSRRGTTRNKAPNVKVVRKEEQEVLWKGIGIRLTVRGESAPELAVGCIGEEVESDRTTAGWCNACSGWCAGVPGAAGDAFWRVGRGREWAGRRARAESDNGGQAGA